MGNTRTRVRECSEKPYSMERPYNGKPGPLGHAHTKTHQRSAKNNRKKGSEALPWKHKNRAPLFQGTIGIDPSTTLHIHPIALLPME
ncbi:MAG: hypothetical protein DSY83_13255 [Flavobacteriia bacterium]|nr:MAG: hypothetical protein DSY83_13255 [Flavobacteriia bacterium]